MFKKYSIANTIWNVLEDVFTFSFNIVKYHKNYNFYKKYYIFSYLIPDRDKRYIETNKYKGIKYDLYEILKCLENMTYIEINEYICDELTKKRNLSILEEKYGELPDKLNNILENINRKDSERNRLNKYLENFYDENEPLNFLNIKN